ncbi:hypothetical protein BD770DRAFT_426323, partial [Pilaira anomala]
MHTKTLLAVTIATLLVQAHAAPQAGNNDVVLNLDTDAQEIDTAKAAEEVDLSSNTNYEEALPEAENTEVSKAGIVKIAAVEDAEKEEGIEKPENPEKEEGNEPNDDTTDKDDVVSD